MIILSIYLKDILNKYLSWVLCTTQFIIIILVPEMYVMYKNQFSDQTSLNMISKYCSAFHIETNNGGE